MRLPVRISILFGALSVVMGAFGAHTASHSLEATAYETYRTAAHYHLLHAVLLFSVLHWGCRLISFWLLFIGTCFFSGSLYLYACFALKPLVYVTPIGGALIILGWLSLLSGKRVTDKDSDIHSC